MSSAALSDAGPDATRPRSGILTPASESSLDCLHDAEASDTRPRKKHVQTGAMTLEHLLKPAIALKPHPPNLHVQPRILHPLMLLPRQHLSLAFIDFAKSSNGAPLSRLHEASIKILDLESRMGSSTSLLLARHDASGTTQIIERQDSGLYTVCVLGSWVQLDELAHLASAICSERLRPAKTSTPKSQAVATDWTTPQLHKEMKKKRAAIEAIQSLVRKRPRADSIAAEEHVEPQEDGSAVEDELQVVTQTTAKSQIGHDTIPRGPPQSSVTPARPIPAEVASPQHDADSLFDHVRAQYGEALYKSMGSLAYFAKGPLSRARSAFHLDLESTLDIADLIEFLTTLILTTTQIDKKYRETIPGIISRSMDIVESSDEKSKRKRKARKMKLGKDRLYPLEDGRIQMWWNTNKPELRDSENKGSDQQIKSHVSLLRLRETQLQMILILEIIALESLQSSKRDTSEDVLPGLPVGTASQEQAAPKKRSKHNLPVLVDVHADRLAIWQSTASEEQILLEDSQALHQVEGESQQTASDEPLKDFCVDVIIPFFSARLPSLCDAINRKLGGPTIAPKSKSSGKSSRKQEQKPGTVVKRSAPAAPRTLQRALSTEQSHRRSVSRGPGNLIALMRSATTSFAGVKREGSEPVALKSIPPSGLNTMGHRQPSLLRSSSSGNLEDGRATKKARVEAELKDAISALRKPNRQVVGQAMAEAAEHRTIGKKPKKPTRHSMPAAVQVKATPANNRFQDVLGIDGGVLADMPLLSTEDVIPPSSVGTLVPSTAPRKGHRDALRPNANPFAGPLGTTPVKRSVGTSFLRRTSDDDVMVPPSSPVMTRMARDVQELVVPASAVKATLAAKDRNQLLFATPVKKAPAPPGSPSDQRCNAAVEEKKGMSIYQRLGWDDEFDDL